MDVARTPVYLGREGSALLAVWPLIALSTVGAVVGTLLGERALLGLAPETFRRVVAGLIGVLGLWLLFGGLL